MAKQPASVRPGQTVIDVTEAESIGVTYVRWFNNTSVAYQNTLLQTLGIDGTLDKEHIDTMIKTKMTELLHERRYGRHSCFSYIERPVETGDGSKKSQTSTVCEFIYIFVVNKSSL